MSLPPLLASILGWLRAGYPNGVPEQDYVPLMALLRRQLSDDEIAVLADDLVADFPVPVDPIDFHGSVDPIDFPGSVDPIDFPGSVDPIDIGVLITKVTDDIPHESDVARVREHLIRGGWQIDAQPPVDDA
ncbi:DUF3349 domain-containing protein [Rhodococcus sp. APC 3903]|uniref:DUF3349 domain-containing protein n=1 Tax=Rhodococcus sp. APC 3903 TaxID=3035193 RepID=UPI0025B3B89B|nr:DUF3349 domain-containing protein [Rhodococcus sp. APC 3903]MDN3455872.1 DUF3349 domain-containing protein [Rhodococcus sp. APC 3903]